MVYFMENPTKMDDMGVSPFLETSIFLTTGTVCSIFRETHLKYLKLWKWWAHGWERVDQGTLRNVSSVLLS